MYCSAYRMVSSLAPKSSSSGRFQMVSTTVRITERASSSAVQLPRIRSASAFSPLPMAMLARGAPPEYTSAAKADTSIISGKHTPTPVSAWVPTVGMWPI